MLGATVTGRCPQPLVAACGSMDSGCHHFRAAALLKPARCGGLDLRQADLRYSPG